MTIRLVPLEFSGHPKEVKLFKVTPLSWKIFKCFSDTTPKTNLHQDIKDLPANERSKAKNLFYTMGQKCESGQSLELLYHGDLLHDACDFTYTNQAGEHVVDKVWRIRQGDLRLYFIYYPPGKRIVLLHLWEKREDKLSSSEEKHLQALAKEIMKSTS
jgi:mRNA-degrading endonuclease RelE of RelBE toxin-antitoxin system